MARANKFIESTTINPINMWKICEFQETFSYFRTLYEGSVSLFLSYNQYTFLLPEEHIINAFKPIEEEMPRFNGPLEKEKYPGMIRVKILTDETSKKPITTLRYTNGEYFKLNDIQEKVYGFKNVRIVLEISPYKLGANTGLRAEAINMTIEELNLQNSTEDWS